MRAARLDRFRLSTSIERTAGDCQVTRAPPSWWRRYHTSRSRRLFALSSAKLKPQRVPAGSDRYEHLVDERGRLQRVAGTFPSHLLSRQLRELLLHERQEAVESTLITATPSMEQRGGGRRARFSLLVESGVLCEQYLGACRETWRQSVPHQRTMSWSAAMFNVRFPAALIGLGLTLLFITPEPARYALFAQAPSSLLVSNWSPSPTTTPGVDHEAYLGGALATLNGTTYMVRSDRCGAWSCSGDFQYLYWSKLTPAGWTPGTWIPNQSSARRVSLAAFNGFLYMVRTDASDEGAVWLSKFNPDTEVWELKSMLSYRTFAGPPAIAAFDNRLHFVGTTGEDPDEIMAPYQMWTATMTAGETFTPARPILGHTSASRPSITVYDNKLYVAHRAGETGEIQYGYRQAGSNVSWTPPKYIRSGPLTAPAGPRFRSVEPAFASVEGYLHLLFRTPESNYVW